jgi:hypothetical protein
MSGIKGFKLMSGEVVAMTEPPMAVTGGVQYLIGKCSCWPAHKIAGMRLSRAKLRLQNSWHATLHTPQAD